MTLAALTDVQCPPSNGQSACQLKVQRGTIYSVLVRAAPGPAAAAALARQVSRFPQFAGLSQARYVGWSRRVVLIMKVPLRQASG
jgi:hypothetical protein